MKKAVGTALVATEAYRFEEAGGCYIPRESAPHIAYIYDVYGKRGRAFENGMEQGSPGERKSAREALQKLNATECNIMRGCFPQFAHLTDRQIRWVTWDIFEDQVLVNAVRHWKKNNIDILADIGQLAKQLAAAH